MSKSIVEFYPSHEKHRCGYCKKPDTSCSRGMWAHFLTVEDYQNLIDRGWRRSGKYCYKPTMDETCCPMYTIKCDALDFKLSKSQKKLLKKVNKYLSNTNSSDIGESENISVREKEPNQATSDAQEHNEHSILNTLGSKTHKKIDVNNLKPSSAMENIQSVSKSQSPVVKVDTKLSSTAGSDICNIPCKKAKQLRLQRKKEKLQLKGIDWENQKKPTPKTEGKSLEDFLFELPECFRDRLKIKLVRTAPPSAEWLESSSETHKLYVKYQVVIHGDTLSHTTKEQFSGFLVKSPLQAEFPDDGPSSGYGSFHQQYWLDNELIAVGVIDILPKCVSAVYFFYDPKYSHLSLGTYGALQEIAFTRQLQRKTNSIKWYYLGFYIHSCPKMKYKGNYHPAFLLCPETYNWSPLEECCQKLEEFPYARLNSDIDAVDKDMPEEKDIENILVLVGNTFMSYNMYKRRKAERKRSLVQTEDASMLQYAKLVGKVTSMNMLLVKE